MSRKTLVAIGITAALIGLATPGRAAKPGGSGSGSSCAVPATDTCTDFVSRGRHWTGPIPYYINVTGAPAGFEQDVQDAFAAWENEVKSPAVEALYPGDHSSVDFTYMGQTTANGARDAKNVVYLSPTSGTAAVSLSTRGSSITGFDMVMNSSWAWSTDVTCPAHNCGTVDVQNAVTHEVGHVIDLYHVTAEADSLLTMYPYPADPSKRASTDWSNETVKRDLGAGEVLAVRKAYPAP